LAELTDQIHSSLITAHELNEIRGKAKSLIEALIPAPPTQPADSPFFTHPAAMRNVQAAWTDAITFIAGIPDDTLKTLHDTAPIEILRKARHNVDAVYMKVPDPTS
jgi:hypothetical protein